MGQYRGRYLWNKLYMEGTPGVCGLWVTSRWYKEFIKWYKLGWHDMAHPAQLARPITFHFQHLTPLESVSTKGGHHHSSYLLGGHPGWSSCYDNSYNSEDTNHTGTMTPHEVNGAPAAVQYSTDMVCWWFGSWLFAWINKIMVLWSVHYQVILSLSPQPPKCFPYHSGG